MATDADFMREALREAQAALNQGEVPVGAVAVANGRIIARAHNERETAKDPTAHAEVLLLRRAARALGRWQLFDVTVYVTLEPCPMCAGAIVQAKTKRLVYGARDARGGCAGSVYRIPEDPAFSTYVKCDGGVLEGECQKMLDVFFKAIRNTIDNTINQEDEE